MAAPQTAYQSQALKLKLGTATSLNIFIAKFLQNTTPTIGDALGDGYFNSADNDSVRKAKILDIFKLDDFVTIQHSTVGKSFVGFINPSGANAPYHNSTRHSRGRVGKDTVEHILLNDAGLNRMPVSTALTDNQVYWYNWISVKIYVRSDFYNSTTSYGYRYRINSGAWNVATVSSTGIAPKVSITEEDRGLLLNSVVEGATFEVQAWATNAEGTTYSNTITQTLDEELVVKDYDRFSAPNNPAETPVQTTIYIPRSKYDLLSTVTTNTTNTGIYFYIQDLCTSAVKAPSAYYTDFTDKVDVGGVFKMYYTDSNGQVVKYETRDIPANPEIRLTLDWLFDMEMKKIWYANFDLLNVTTNLTTYTITGTVVQRNSLGNIVNSNIASVSGTISSGTFGGFDELGELTYTASAGDYFTIESVSISPTIAYTSVSTENL